MNTRQTRLESLRRALGTAAPPDRFALIAERLFDGPAARAPTAAMHFLIRTRPTSRGRGDILERLSRLDSGFSPDSLGRVDTHLPPDAPWLAGLVARFAADQLGRSLALELAHGSSIEADDRASGWFEHFLPPFAVPALRWALAAVGWAAAGETRPDRIFPQQRFLDRAIASDRPSLQSLVLMRSARVMGIPFLQIGSSHAIWQFGWGERSIHFWTTASTGDSSVGHYISIDKERSKRFLKQLGMPTPRWRTLGPNDDPDLAAGEVGWPCVVKPTHGGGGQGVTADISDPADLAKAVALARQSFSNVLIEAHQPGNDHRLMVVDRQLVAAVRREPATATGDGRRSVSELIDEMNEERRRPSRPLGYLLPVPIDDMLAMTLAKQKMTLESIPPAGQRVLLRTNANFSTGGTAIDVRHLVHPTVVAAAERIAAAADLRIVGIDYITPDISRSWAASGGAFIEINTTAAIDVLGSTGMDLHPLCRLLLGEIPGRIPTALVICGPDDEPNIRTALAERLTPGEAAAGADWSQIGGAAIPSLGLDPVERATAVLRQPTVAKLTILWSFDLIRRHGLPLDRFDLIVLVGAPLPKPWNLTLERQSRHLLGVRTAADAIEALAGWPGNRSGGPQP